MESSQLEFYSGSLCFCTLICSQIFLLTSQSQTDKHSNVKLQRWIAIASSLLLVVKFTAYYLTNSVSILTDALESIVNVVAGFIGLYSLYVAAKPRDIDHPYGHGKAEFISAAIEGTLVLSAGVLIIYNAAPVPKGMSIKPPVARSVVAPKAFR